MDTDRLMVKQVLAGQSESFTIIVNNYYPKIVAFLCKMGTSREDSEDIAQEVFIKAYNNLYKYNEHWSLSTWLFKIAINTFKNVKKKKRIKTEQICDNYMADFSYLPESSVETIHNQQLVQKMFGSLKEDVKTIMILRYYQELSFKEIGEICGLSPEAAKMKISRGISRLYKTYGNSRNGGEYHEV